MSSKTPIRTVFNDSGVATGLAEFQTGEFIPLSHGGIGAALSIGSAGQVLKVNTGGSALEFGNVEAIVNIDGATDKTSATLVAGDQILLSDGGTEGRVTLSQLDTLFSATSKTLTNKTIAAGSNTISGLTNSNLSGSAGITNANLANSAVTLGSTAVSLGGTATSIAGLSLTGSGTIDLTGAGSKARFNFAGTGAFPNESTYEGMFAYDTSGDKPYVADAAGWINILTENDGVERHPNVNITGISNGQALIWSSAGGSIKTDPAGVWWASMPFTERINYAAFVNNQEQIESDWGATFGDRKIEIVFIGQELDVELITNQLESCLLNEEELMQWKNGEFNKIDNWPVSSV